MREFARESLIRGEGISSRYRQIVPKPKKWIFGHSIAKQEFKMPKEFQESKFLSLSDLISILQEYSGELKKFSPYPSGECITAVASEIVETLILSLVRTPPRQTEIGAPKLKKTAAEDEKRGKAAAIIAEKIIASQKAKDLTGEEYVELMSTSPRPDLTRAELKQAQVKGTYLTGPAGGSVKVNKTPLKHDIQCAGPQTLKVQVDSIHPSGKSVFATVVGFGEHEQFWKSFPDTRLEIDVLDKSVQHGLLLSRFLKDDVELELSISIGLQQARGCRDVCRGSILSMPNLRSIALKAIMQLNEQLSLDLQFPEISSANASFDFQSEQTTAAKEVGRPHE
jgi:hypothetical protein